MEVPASFYQGFLDEMDKIAADEGLDIEKLALSFKPITKAVSGVGKRLSSAAGKVKTFAAEKSGVAGRRRARLNPAAAAQLPPGLGRRTVSAAQGAGRTLNPLMARSRFSDWRAGRARQKSAASLRARGAALPRTGSRVNPVVGKTDPRIAAHAGRKTPVRPAEAQKSVAAASRRAEVQAKADRRAAGIKKGQETRAKNRAAKKPAAPPGATRELPAGASVRAGGGQAGAATHITQPGQGLWEQGKQMYGNLKPWQKALGWGGAGAGALYAGSRLLGGNRQQQQPAAAYGGY